MIPIIRRWEIGYKKQNGGEEVIFESLKRTLIKSLTYRVVHFLIHRGEARQGILIRGGWRYQALV